MLASGEWPPGGISILAKSSNDSATVGRLGYGYDRKNHICPVLPFACDNKEKKW
jgi:hypothetical protein